MGASLFSPSWYRVASLRPRLRPHVDIHRHIYRGQVWYVLEDRLTGRFQRFTPSAYVIIGLMDGHWSVEELWHTARVRLGEDAPTQDDLIRLLSQLHSADLLQSDVPPDTLELLQRFEKRQHPKWKQNIRNPMAMRFSLFDPETLLRKGEPYVRPLFSWAAGVFWLVVVLSGCVMAGLHWGELTQDITDRILAPQNLVVLWLVYPCLKALHEFGHAFTIKRLGGEVHEMGIMFLVLTPIPYVDASWASALQSKWQRAFVGAAGMAVELFIAAIALFLWTLVEPGAFRSVLYDIVIIAGVSSLLFNGNPLLRYDAYYILSDLLEIPNLAPRGTQYFGYLIQHYAFGVRDAEPPVSTGGERIWFIIYGISSFFYRIVVYVAIVLFIAGKFFTLGVLLAVWAVASMGVFPLVKGSRFLFSSPRIVSKRKRAALVTCVFLGCIIALVTLAPFPLSTVSEGVFWFPDEVFVRARADGFVKQLRVSPGTPVRRGDILVVSEDPLLPARVQILESQLRQLEATYDSQFRKDAVKAELAFREMRHTRDELADARKRFSELTAYSMADGTFVSLFAQDLEGKFVKRGEVLGFVLDRASITARVAVPQSDLDLVRNRTKRVDVRLPEKPYETVHASLIREVPAATDRLPSRILGRPGGGEIPIDPRDEQGTKAFQKIFLFDIQLPASTRLFSVGGRVHVRFDYGMEPLIHRWHRHLRELLLTKFNI